MPTDTEPKMRKPNNISPEERERRRQRMIELRRRLQEEKEIKAKPVRPTKAKSKPKPKAEPVNSDSESEESEVDSEIEELSHKTAPPKRHNTKPKASKPISIPQPAKSSNVVKKVSIKYYGNVSDEQMAKDRELLNGISSNTTSTNDVVAKKPKRTAKPKKDITNEEKKPTTPPPTPTPEPAKIVDKNAMFRQILGYN